MGPVRVPSRISTRNYLPNICFPSYQRFPKCIKLYWRVSFEFVLRKLCVFFVQICIYRSYRRRRRVGRIKNEEDGVREKVLDAHRALNGAHEARALDPMAPLGIRSPSAFGAVHKST